MSKKNKDKKGMKRASSLVLYRKSDRSVLIGYHNRYQCWGIPGGKVEEGESYEECAIRECMEETGILPYRVEPINGLYTSKDGSFYIKLFLIETEAEAFADEREFAAFNWIKVDDLKSSDLIFLGHSKEFILDAVKSTNKQTLYI